MGDKSSTVFSECFNIKEKTFGPLHIIKHETYNICFLLLWNEFSVLTKRIESLNSIESFHYTDFAVKQIHLQENIFLCLDTDGNLYFTILKKKNESRILEKLEFKPILKNVLLVLNNESDIYVVLKKDNCVCMYNYIFLGSSKIKVTKVYKLDMNTNISDCNIAMKVKKMGYFSIDFIQHIFHIEISKINMDRDVLFMSKDNNLYWCILEENSNVINCFEVLYSSSANIKSFDLLKDTGIKVNLNLETGSIIILSYDVTEKNLSVDIVHLNSYLDKVMYLPSTLVYSDGNKIYNCLVELKVDEYNITLREVLPIYCPYCFIYDSDLFCIYATSIHSNIYKVSLGDIKNNKSVTFDTTVQIPRDFTVIKNVMSDIQRELEQSSECIKMTDKENDYISIIFLNSKQNILKNCLSVCFKVCRCNQSVDYDDVPIIYSGNIVNEIIIVVELSIEEYLQNKFESMMKNIDGIFFINVQLELQNTYISCNTSVLLSKTPKLRLGIPHHTELTPPLIVKLSLISQMPGVFHGTHQFWSIINANKIYVDSTYFMSCKSLNTIPSLLNYNKQKNYKDKIVSVAERHCKLVCDVHEELKPNQNIYFSYVRLPEQFEKSYVQFCYNFAAKLSPGNAEIINKNLNDPNFIQGVKIVTLQIFTESVELTIEKSGNNEHRLRIKSRNDIVCFEVYQYIIEILRMQKDDVKKLCVPHFNYIILKNLKENMEKVMSTSQMTHRETLLEFSEAFNRDVLGELPL